MRRYCSYYYDWKKLANPPAELSIKGNFRQTNMNSTNIAIAVLLLLDIAVIMVIPFMDKYLRR